MQIPAELEPRRVLRVVEALVPLLGDLRRSQWVRPLEMADMPAMLLAFHKNALIHSIILTSGLWLEGEPPLALKHPNKAADTVIKLQVRMRPDAPSSPLLHVVVPAGQQISEAIVIHYGSRSQ